MPKNTTFVSFLLDETGSMQSVQAETVNGFNSYVETLQKDAADMVFSFVSFNSNETNQRYIAEPLDAVTRARRRMTLVSSFTHDEVDLDRAGELVAGRTVGAVDVVGQVPLIQGVF